MGSSPGRDETFAGSAGEIDGDGYGRGPVRQMFTASRPGLSSDGAASSFFLFLCSRPAGCSVLVRRTKRAFRSGALFFRRRSYSRLGTRFRSVVRRRGKFDSGGNNTNSNAHTHYHNKKKGENLVQANDRSQRGLPKRFEGLGGRASVVRQLAIVGFVF